MGKTPRQFCIFSGLLHHSGSSWSYEKDFWWDTDIIIENNGFLSAWENTVKMVLRMNVFFFYLSLLRHYYIRR